MDHDIPHTQLLRLNFIEFRLLFAGEVGRGDLMRRFGIKEAAATKDFTAYRGFFPNNIEFDQSRKVYRPTKEFSPSLISGRPQKTLLRALVHGTGDDFSESVDPLVPCELPVRLYETRLDTLAAVSRCIYSGGVLRIRYLSGSGSTKKRDIVPFSFAGNGLRWHVRAYDRLKGRFGDFVINRIVAAESLDETAKASERRENDEQWNRMVRLEIVPHPKTKNARMLEIEFGMENGLLECRVRAALVGYVLRLWNVDCTADASLKGREYALWLRNRATLYDAENAEIAPGYVQD